jgi:hypothetical protein
MIPGGHRPPLQRRAASGNGGRFFNEMNGLGWFQADLQLFYNFPLALLNGLGVLHIEITSNKTPSRVSYWFPKAASASTRLKLQLMKPKLILCLALVLSGGLFGCSSSQTLHNGAVTKTSLEKNGVTVEVSLPDAVSAGEPVEMVVNVTNAAPKSVFYMNWIRALGIHLVDSNNATPEMTPRGKSGPDSVIDYGINSATPQISELKPGEHYEWRVDLGTLFILKPGKYLVSVNLKFSQSVPGGAVPFEISTAPLGFTEEKIKASQTNQ